MRQLAPYWGGRVQMRSPEGWTWQQPAQAPTPGWYWWSESLDCLGPAEEYEISGLPLQLVQKLEEGQALVKRQKVELRLGERLLVGDWVKAWWDGQVAWAVRTATGPTPPRQARAWGRDLSAVRRAVERGGGVLLSAAGDANGWTVSWARGGVDYQSRVDRHLNVVSAGFCLSGGDRAQDLTTLVSLVEGSESNNADPRVWRGNSRG